MKMIICAALSATLLLGGCSKAETDAEPSGGNTTVELSFGIEQGVLSRSFDLFEDQGWLWEQKIHKMLVGVYTVDGEMIKQKELTVWEIAAGKTGFDLPVTANGESYTFCAVANWQQSDLPPTLSELLSLYTDNPLSEYNAPLDEILNYGLAHDRGFLMSGLSSAAVNPNTPVKVHIPLMRAMAKVAIEISLSEDFYERHKQGLFYISTVQIRYPPQSVYLVPAPEVRRSGDTALLELQGIEKDGTYRYLCYINEMDIFANQRCNIVIRGNLDRDGDLSDTSDFQGVVYTIPIHNIYSTHITRNTFYRVSAQIRGLDATEIVFNYSVKNWYSLPESVIQIGS